MTKEEIKAMLPVLQAFVDGKAIQSRCVKGDTSLWYDDEDPSFVDDDLIYRIKPEPTYRSFANAEECWKEMQKHQPVGWIYDGGYHYFIVSIDDETINIINNTRDIVECLFSEMIEEGYTFADGTPFGVKVE